MLESLEPVMRTKQRAEGNMFKVLGKNKNMKGSQYTAQAWNDQRAPAHRKAGID